MRRSQYLSVCLKFRLLSMPKKSFNDVHFLFILFICCLLLGQQTYKSIFAQDMELVTYSMRSPSSEKKNNYSENQKQDRNNELSPTAVFSEKIVIDIACDDNNNERNPSSTQDELKVNSNFVHFKGKVCLDKFSSDNIKLENTSNGFMASIFELPNQTFRTDFIHLKPGENKIKLVYNLKNTAEREKNIIITYTPL